MIDCQDWEHHREELLRNFVEFDLNKVMELLDELGDKMIVINYQDVNCAWQKLLSDYDNENLTDEEILEKVGNFIASVPKESKANIEKITTIKQMLKGEDNELDWRAEGAYITVAIDKDKP